MGNLFDTASELPDRPLQFLLGFCVKVTFIGAANGKTLSSFCIDDSTQFRPTDLEGDLQLTAGDDIPLSGVILFQILCDGMDVFLEDSFPGHYPKKSAKKEGAVVPFG